MSTLPKISTKICISVIAKNKQSTKKQKNSMNCKKKSNYPRKILEHTVRMDWNW